MSEHEIQSDDSGKKPKASVLEFRGVTFPGRSENSVRLSEANLIVREGELGVLHLDPLQNSREIASMMQGLIKPNSGQVLYQSKDWLGDDYERHFRMRSQIGRVFEGQAWIENLNVDENVVLASRHHGLTETAIAERIESWTTRLGLKGLSRKRPAFLEPSLLQIHQWVRAFIGNPKLLILERPMRSVSLTELPKFIDALDEFRRRGASIFWFTNNHSIATEGFAPPLIHFEVRDKKLVQVEGRSHR